MRLLYVDIDSLRPDHLGCYGYHRPLMTVLREGGPFYTRGYLPRYLERLRATGRAHHAERLAHIHPDEI